MTQRSPHRFARSRATSVLAVTLLVGASGCGDSLAESLVPMPDGRYSVMTNSPRVVNEFYTPGWMRETPSIDFTKEGDSFVVTDASDDLVVLGPAQLVEPEDGFWRVRFGWAPDQDHHYWQIAMTAEQCVASAVDADLGVGPDGVLTVTLGGCLIERR